MAIKSNQDVIKFLFKEINKSSDRGKAAHRFHQEMMERLEYYITQWADVEASGQKGWERQGAVFKMYAEDQIQLIREYRIALVRATRAAELAEKKNKKANRKDLKLVMDEPAVAVPDTVPTGVSRSEDDDTNS